MKTAADGTQTFYVYGLGLIGEESAAGYKAYHFDFRGSTVALSDESGAVSARFSYSAYGVLLSGDVSVTPFLFNGQYGVMTDGNGLYHMRARFYSAEIRRFLNRDILLGDVARGQSLNRFGFVTGKPISSLDPLGLAAIDIPFPEAPSWLPEWVRVGGARVLGLAGIVLSISGDTPNTQTNSDTLTRVSNWVILFHGTDVTSAIALLNGAPLNIEIARQLQHDVNDIGFYLATDIAVAEHFAAVRGGDGTVLQYALTQDAIDELVGAGCVFRPITPGRNFNPPGLEFLIIPSAFNLFDLLRDAGQIIVTPALIE